MPKYVTNEKKRKVSIHGTVDVSVFDWMEKYLREAQMLGNPNFKNKSQLLNFMLNQVIENYNPEEFKAFHERLNTITEPEPDTNLMRVSDKERKIVYLMRSEYKDTDQ